METTSPTSKRSTRARANLLNAQVPDPIGQTGDQPTGSTPSPSSTSPPRPLTSRGGNSPLRSTPTNDNQGTNNEMVAITGQEARPIGPTRKRGRRRPTMGHGLQNYVQRNGGSKMHIEFKEGKPRPQDPIQAAKLSSECGIHIRSTLPVVPHWKNFKKEELKDAIPNAITAVANKFDMDKDSEVAQNVCTQIIQKNLRNHRYKLKRDYFLKVPPEQRLANIPPNMMEESWARLCNKWSTEEYQRLCAKNKKNRDAVTQHQTTGSRSYVATYTYLKSKYNNQEPNAIQFYKESHTEKDGSMSKDTATPHSAMLEKMTDSQSDGAQSKTDVEIVGEVLKEQNASSTFLANISYPASLRRPSTAVARRIQELEDRLQAQEMDARRAYERQQEQLSLRIETQQMEIEELRTKQQPEIEAMKKSYQDEMENIKNNQQDKIAAFEKKQQEMDALLGYLLRQQAQSSAASSGQTSSAPTRT